ncbi:1ef7f0ad-5c73-4e5c-85bd-f26aa92ee786-CDS [Sclerotinia trifoliorum]|uniref:1ef7f0ad-5c73-4e5c-85bd-f26aa92ee786-CDS n=1 Tax=Sclerotinia trifoliorum TaxID=28548 RepID=A0A8H2W6W7_9HELO|nr:1ef7f0ad-5c73-4e5c-85bd-f26aa92ee786-CDS [Sclerotinia trifoliorum]
MKTTKTPIPLNKMASSTSLKAEIAGYDLRISYGASHFDVQYESPIMELSTFYFLILGRYLCTLSRSMLQNWGAFIPIRRFYSFHIAQLTLCPNDLLRKRSILA